LTDIAEQHWRERAHDLQAEVRQLTTDLERAEDQLRVERDNYAQLLQRWKSACQDVAQYRDQLQRLGAFDP